MSSSRTNRRSDCRCFCRLAHGITNDSRRSIDTAGGVTRRERKREEAGRSSMAVSTSTARRSSGARAIVREAHEFGYQSRA